MKTTIHKAATRGHANHGWLDSHHTFSFANYYDPERIHFGALRVLNDDIIDGGEGFGKHPHDNMEIISIPLTGDLEHKDSMGNTTIIRAGEVQVMSAGKGIYHSEYNKNPTKEANFLQIWIFPNKKDVTPRYDQVSLRDLEKPDALYQILSPDKDDAGMWIHQNAWFHMGRFDSDTSLIYKLKQNSNGVYLFVIEGEVEAGNQKLHKRDGMGIWETDAINMAAGKGSKLLLMEVPMQW